MRSTSSVVDVLRHPVADDPHHQVGLLVDAARRGEVAARGLHVLVGAEQDAQVLHERAVRGALAGRADDEPAVLRDELLEAVEDLLEALALLGVADLARDAAERAAALGAVAGHEDEVSAGDRERGGDARALRADRALGDLDRDDRAGGEALGDLLVGEALAAGLPAAVLLAAVLPAALVGLLVLVVVVEERVVVGVHVPVVEERVLAHADVDERGLEVVLQILDAAPEDGADEALVGRVLDLELLEAAVLEDGDARLELLGVDDDLAREMVGLARDPLELEEILREHGKMGLKGCENGETERTARAPGSGPEAPFAALGGGILPESSGFGNRKARGRLTRGRADC